MKSLSFFPEDASRKESVSHMLNGKFSDPNLAENKLFPILTG